MTPSWWRSRAGARSWRATWRCAIPPLPYAELNHAVQMTIDRIIFLRICEDRGIERENQLREVVEGAKVYATLTHALPAGRRAL